jgi:hypothetical protein
MASIYGKSSFDLEEFNKRLEFIAQEPDRDRFQNRFPDREKRFIQIEKGNGFDYQVSIQEGYGLRLQRDFKKEVMHNKNGLFETLDGILRSANDSRDYDLPLNEKIRVYYDLLDVPVAKAIYDMKLAVDIEIRRRKEELGEQES